MKTQHTEIEQKMQKTLDALARELASLRAGRANPAVLDKLYVEYYGAQTPINQIASISTPDARTLLISPWDESSLKAIERAIQASDIGINPSNDGDSIRLVFPPLTEERRKELVKKVRQIAEESKVALRSIRRDAIEKYKALKKKSEITEDDLRVIEKDIQELTDRFVKEVDSISAKKEKELMEI